MNANTFEVLQKQREGLELAVRSGNNRDSDLALTCIALELVDIHNLILHQNQMLESILQQMGSWGPR